ncbi:Hypothetical protein PHPALM_4222 [Phytophthora palmivora]|uniref:Uncharacterized protein n=1 Tax=Phytophthora palmivora TaxID=4796 RepID=A0A2P4YKF3_9STRA|nr:Hypothetical protein PHPALM_4222 [Phytophthora palmivora]
MVKTYKERQATQKRMKAKNNPWPTPKSRKKSRQARRAPVKDSKRVYHAKTMQTLFIQAFLKIPGVREALQRLRAKRDEESKQNAPQQRNNVEWPSNIIRSLQLNIKEGVKLKDNWPTDQCNCYGDCYPDICPNAAGDLFCARDNCRYRGRCSNGVYETHDVELFESHTGIGVRATDTIQVGTTIAPYTGLLTDFDYDRSDTQHEYVIDLQTSGRGGGGIR